MTANLPGRSSIVVMRRVALAPFAFITLPLLAACVAQVDGSTNRDDEVAVTAEALYSQPDNWTFSYHDINVCFVDAADTIRSEDANVRTWIEDSYGRVTDLRFKGWGLCPSSCNPTSKWGGCPAGIVLRIDTTNIAWSTHHDGKVHFSRIGTKYGAFQAGVMHEFGHSLGFDHELDRADETLGCENQGVQTCRTLPDENGKTMVDPFSVSNTNGCTQNYHTCNFKYRAGEGSVITAGCNEGSTLTGNTYFRLVDPSGKVVASNNDGAGCGVLSQITYTVPVGGAGFYTLRQGCAYNTSCSGTTKYEITDDTGVGMQDEVPITYTPRNDLKSIMASTYCGPAWTNLSPWDVVGLQRVYGRKPVGSIVGYRNKCLAIDNTDFAYADPPSKQIKVWDCLNGEDSSLGYDLNQSFIWNFPGGDYHLRSNYSGRGVLEVKSGGTANGTAVVNNNASTSSTQSWRFNGVQLRGMGDLCFDIPHGNFVAGALVELWQCVPGSADQLFDVFPYSIPGNPLPSAVVIAPRGSPGGLVLTVDHAASSTHGRVTLQPLTTVASKNATQIFTTWGDGQLANLSDGLCLDATGADPRNGTLIQTYKCRFDGPDQVAQQITIHGPILAVASKKCLDVDVNSGPQTGSKVQIWDCNGRPQQDWDYHF